MPLFYQSNEANQWSRPTSTTSITSICLRFLTSETSSWPFSPSPLSAESELILPHLKRLATAGWWPVGSQPAVDGAKSEDEVLGWGPKGGYVFQKAFVEFFVSEEEVRRLEAKVREKVREGEAVDFLACNFKVSLSPVLYLPRDWDADRLICFVKDDLRTNVEEGQRNAVTWGVFPGQEIVQTTIIERESFLSWKVRLFPDLHFLVNTSPKSAVLIYCTHRRKLSRYGATGPRSTRRVQKSASSWRAFATPIIWSMSRIMILRTRTRFGGFYWKPCRW